LARRVDALFLEELQGNQGRQRAPQLDRPAVVVTLGLRPRDQVAEADDDLIAAEGAAGEGSAPRTGSP
jgi:hypothetical protein